MNNILITIIGAGSYGTALGIAFARNGHRVMLWGYDPLHIKQLQNTRYNQKFLPGIKLPNNLLPELSLQNAVIASNNILIVIPSFGFKSILKKIQPYLTTKSRIIWATKGLEYGTGRLLQEVIHEVLGNTIPSAIFSGPTFAKELAKGLPTTIVVSASDEKFSKELKTLFHYDKKLMININTDMIGVQIGGAIKNIIAIGAGILDGIGFGANAKVVLITQGINEISKLGVAMGAKLSTFMGITGLGDLILTCTDNQSRNRRFGILIGQGLNIDQATKQINQVIEGYLITKEVYLLSLRMKIKMPITEQVYEILFKNKNIYNAANVLLNCDTEN